MVRVPTGDLRRLITSQAPVPIFPPPPPPQSEPSKHSPLTIGVLIGLLSATAAGVGWVLQADEYVRRIAAQTVSQHGFDSVTHGDIRAGIAEHKRQIEKLSDKLDLLEREMVKMQRGSRRRYR